MSGDKEPSRRSVLRRLGTAATGVSLFGGVAAAAEPEGPAPEEAASAPLHQFLTDTSTDVDESTRTEVFERYDDVASVRSEFEAAEPILRELAAEGYLESASLSEFVFAEVHEGEVLEPSDAATGVGVRAIDHPDGASAHLTATTRSADHRIAINRLPEHDVTYAFVEEDDRLVFHDQDDDEVTPDRYCTWESLDCTNSFCSTGSPPWCLEYQRYCCLYSDGSYECTDSRYTCACRCDY